MKLALLNSRLACLSIALAVLSGCDSKQPLEQGEPAPLIPLAQEIQRRGYHMKQSLVVTPTAWEISTFRMRGKRSFWFRADQPLPNARDTYCRFSLFEETYDSVDDARHRLARLHDAFPRAMGGPEDDEYSRTMRTGFRVGTVTYILQTDAAMFWDEVQRLAKALANSTLGAELARAYQRRSPNKSLDRKLLS